MAVLDVGADQLARRLDRIIAGGVAIGELPPLLVVDMNVIADVEVIARHGATARQGGAWFRFSGARAFRLVEADALAPRRRPATPFVARPAPAAEPAGTAADAPRWAGIGSASGRVPAGAADGDPR